MSEVNQEFVRVDLPREGLPDLIDSRRGLTWAAEKLASGVGPVAIDAERASGFKYSQRAYLVQLRRENAGTFLIDPTEFENLSPIQDSLKDVDWILHAASQDLVCLSQVGLKPTKSLFDTELAGRLLGLPKVGLGTLVETHLGFSLAKEHSAADWSTRPLPDEWLAYAALDVEFLIELWQILQAQLTEQNKLDWALEEFNHVMENTAPIVREEPWRRISGIHKIKDRRQLAVARSIWQARDQIASELDIASGRLLNDSQLVEMAIQANWDQVLELPFIKLRIIQRNLKQWEKAFKAGQALAQEHLPDLKVKTDSPPHPRNWQSRHPELYANFEAVRFALGNLAEELMLPIENLISPEVIRRIIWKRPKDFASVEEILTEHKVRNWQKQLISKPLTEVLNLN